MPGLFGEYVGDTITLRKPCGCRCERGFVEMRGGQAVVYCADCRTHQGYNASKAELGLKPRTLETMHNLPPSQRYRIIERATGRCEVCRDAERVLHVGHFLSLKHGTELGLTEAELNSDENLAAMCEVCNLGAGEIPLPLRLAIAIIRARTATLKGLAK